ncbi:hypothetical protein BN2877_51390 [Achromobacter xylosoxidans]|nr:hypothetical protein BN2877_51390 [Achromobacter xylosoxidans]
MVQDAGGHAGFFDHRVARQDRADPAQVQFADLHRPAAHHHAGVGRVVGDGVEHLARALAVGVDAVRAGIDDLQRRDHVVDRVVHLEQRHVRALQALAQHEGQLHFQARQDEAAGGNVAAVLEEHVIEQHAEIGLVDLRRQLHGARGQADLVAALDAAFAQLDVHPGALDGVGVGDGDVGVLQRDLADLLAAAFGVVQARRQGAHGGSVKHAGNIQVREIRRGRAPAC